MQTTYDTQIEQIVQSIFSSMLGMDVMRAPDGIDFQETLLGTIQLAGAETLSVIVGVSEGAAAAATATMMQLPPESISDDDERDVVAELANMIGGNLKSILPGPLYLSLPTVVAGRELGLQVPGAELVDDVLLQCDAGALRVRLYSKVGE